jgi:iron complex transport system substrate-binding protein
MISYRTRLIFLGICLTIGVMVGLVEFTHNRRDTPEPVVRQEPGNPASRGPMRIVSLAPSITEILFALGVQEKIVGVTEHCNFPPAAREIQRVGAFGKPNCEVLLALEPTLVVANGLDPSVPAGFFAESGIRFIDLRTDNLDGVLKAVSLIGKAVEQPERGRLLVDWMQSEFDDIKKRFHDVRVEFRPRVFVELWSDPLTTAGKNSFIDDVICLAGGDNVAGELSQHYFVVNPEQVIKWNPDVIVLGYMTDGSANAADVGARIGWSEISAVKRGHVVTDVPPDLLLRPGPRIVQGARMLAERIHRR